MTLQDNMNSKADSQAAREVVWQHTQDQWQEIVARTVPLVRRMNSRVLKPLTISPTQ